MNNGEYILAQFGNRHERKRSRAMLLDIADLPDGTWKVIGDRRWRTGTRGEHGELAERARLVGSFTAWRSFKSETPAGGFWTTVILFASKGDAELAVPNSHNMILKNPKFTGSATGDQIISDQEIPGVDVTLVSEQLTITNDGPGSTKYVAGNVGRVFFMMAFAQRGAAWPWSEITSISAIQACKIRKELETSDFPR